VVGKYWFANSIFLRLPKNVKDLSRIEPETFTMVRGRNLDQRQQLTYGDAEG
jgi:hypothetical protein